MRVLRFQRHVMRRPTTNRERQSTTLPYDTVPALSDEEGGTARESQEETYHRSLEGNNNHYAATTEFNNIVSSDDQPQPSARLTVPTEEEFDLSQHVRILLPNGMLRPTSNSVFTPPRPEFGDAVQSDSFRTERRQRAFLMFFLVLALFHLWGQYIITGDPLSLMLAVLGSSYVYKLGKAFRNREEEIERLSRLGGLADGASDEDLALVLSRIREMMATISDGSAVNSEPAGVSDSARKAWKKFAYKQDDKSLEITSDIEEAPSCSICLEEYGDGDDVMRLPCNHIFHRSCIEEWAAGHTRCPLCNFDLEAVEEEGHSLCNNACIEEEELTLSAEPEQSGSSLV
mmetsp:Transcript_8216/g.17841  ORF Transcript_8216/g.17841 Transcript_8216/m.17841 type:complete len:344 (-) Transcript_8216:1889-2920(-)